jgi:hypothetical protein
MARSRLKGRTQIRRTRGARVANVPEPGGLCSRSDLIGACKATTVATADEAVTSGALPSGRNVVAPVVRMAGESAQQL